MREGHRKGASRLRLVGSLGVLAALTLGFLAMTVLWLALDESVPDHDTGRNLINTYTMHGALAAGDLTAPWTVENTNTYPPLVYVAGALGVAIGGPGLDAVVLALNGIFVPLLVLGCWGTARLAYGEAAGLVAVVVALGAPIVAGLFHLVLLDAAQAAMVAMTVWLVLASRRFASIPVSALAGVFGGLAAMTKTTTVVFLAGLLVVVLLRGGWRNWRGLAVAGVLAAIVAAPWHLAHLDELSGLTGGAAAAPGGGTYSHVSPPRWSSANAGWYVWNLLNVQLLLPLTLAAAAGAAVAVWRFVRERSPRDVTPELLAGGLVAYLGMTWISLKDERYTTPAIVYLAVLGSAWVPALRGRPRAVAVAAVCVVAAVNLVAVTTPLDGALRISGPDAPPTQIRERTVTLYAGSAYVLTGTARDARLGEPRDDGDARRMLVAAKADGVGTIEFDPALPLAATASGMNALASEVGVLRPPVYDPASLGPREGFVYPRNPVLAGDPPPCARVADGTGLYMVLGSPLIPFEDQRLYCPLREPAFYGPGAR